MDFLNRELIFFVLFFEKKRKTEKEEEGKKSDELLPCVIIDPRSESSFRRDGQSLLDGFWRGVRKLSAEEAKFSQNVHLVSSFIFVWQSLLMAVAEIQRGSAQTSTGADEIFLLLFWRHVPVFRMAHDDTPCRHSTVQLAPH